MPPAPTPRTYRTEMQKETKACSIYLLQYDKVIYSVKHNTYRMSQEEWTKLRESVPYVKIF